MRPLHNDENDKLGFFVVLYFGTRKSGYDTHDPNLFEQRSHKYLPIALWTYI